MNQQACLFIDDRETLKKMSSSQGDEFLKLSNKFRSFVFILKDHYLSWDDFEKTVHAHSVLPLNEMLTQFMTYSIITEKSITHPVVIKQPTLYWIQDIDNFIGLPREIEQKIYSFSPHMYFYDNLDFLSKNK